VHRLDKDTTGVVVVAKTPSVHAALSAQFSSRTAERSYQALIFGTPRNKALGGDEQGTIDTSIGRDLKDRRKMSVQRSLAKPGTAKIRRAVTSWKVLEWMSHGALVALRLGTGRTHQIRVHMLHRGSPVIGDLMYGWDRKLPSELARAAAAFGRQALHAATLGFDHPVSGKRMSFSSPLPADMQQLVDLFRRESDGRG
jgi:23S rRNA pseudouridine1911/1915/1917 synthase